MSGRHAAALMNTAPFVIARAFKKMDLETKLSNPIGYLTYIYSFSIIIDIKRGSKMLQEAASYYKRMKDMPDRDQVLAVSGGMKKEVRQKGISEDRTDRKRIGI